MTTTIQKRNGAPATAPRDRALFDALRSGADTVAWNALPEALARVGLRRDDPRLRESFERLHLHDPQEPLTYEQFRDIVRPGGLLIERALQGALAVPDFAEFCDEVLRLYNLTKANTDGAVADYIPQLARVDPDQYGAALCTIDGQRFAVGDATTEFCVQSTCKPISYCLALETQGTRTVHKHIGREPSGKSFNELALNEEGLPHNPMINAGGIMSSSLIKPELPMADRFDYVMGMWQELAGGAKPGFSNPTYLSERRTADRNFALGYSIREHGGFPADTNLVETLEFYFQCCSLEMTGESMAVVAATLANGGICPTNGKRVLEPETVQKCLSLMYSCGMYNFSGEWAFSIGLPAKSGVSGLIVVVVPNVMGLCTWSPRLDQNGNSVRGIDFYTELVKTFNFHNYDNLVGAQQAKKDPRLPRNRARSDRIADLCWAASEGDLAGIRRLVAKGVNLDDADYDGRTPLHLAASEGHGHVVDFFLRHGARPDPRDRWQATPLDDARREGHTEVARLLEEAQ